MQPPNQTQRITVNVADLASSGRTDAVRVLHVDDDPCILEVSKEILMTEGNFEIDCASCVDDALEKLRTEHYDAVVSDYEMPQKNGLQFLKELREEKNEIPFILFTGKGREDVAIKALNLGSDAYINKAGPPETVYAELSDALLKTLERKRSKKLLADSEIKYRTLIEDMTQGVVIVQGPQPHVVFANSAMEKISGFSSQEIFSFTAAEIAKLIHPDDREEFLNRLSRRLAGEVQESAYEFKGIKKDGSTTWLEICSSLIEYNGQRSIQGVFLDITQRKIAELKLIESESKYRSIFDNNEAAMFRGISDGGIIIDCNEKFLNYLGLPREEVLGKPSLPYWVDPHQRQEMVRLLKAQGHLEDFEFKSVNKKGEVKTCLTSIKLFPDGIVEGSIIDITYRKNAELELEQKYEALERVAESIGAGLAIIDKNYQVVWANAVLRNMGVSSNKKCYQTFNNLNTICLDCGAKKIFEQNVPLDIHEYKSINSEGEATWLELRVTPLKGKNGNVTAALELVVPINERKKAEEALKESEERYHKLSSAAFEGIGISREGKILDINSQFAEMLGYEVSELVGKNVFDFVAPESLDFVKANIQKGFEGPYEHLAMRKDGSVFPVEIRARLIAYKGRPARVSVIRDITDRKKAEEEIAESERKYKDIFDNAMDAVIVHDLKGKVISVNKTVEKFGFAQDQIIGKNMLKFVPKKYWPKLISVLLQETQGNREEGEIEVNTPKGRLILQFRSSPIIRNGKIVAVHSIMRDITERKKSEEFLKRSEEKFRKLAEESPSMIFINKRDRIIYANKKCEDITGYTREEFYSPNFNFFSLCAPEYVDAMRSSYERQMKGKHVPLYDFVLLGKDDKRIDVMTTSQVIEYEGEMAELVIVTDISELKKAREELENNKNYFETLMTSVLSGIIVVDSETHKIVDANPATLSLIGASKEEIVGRVCHKFFCPAEIGKCPITDLGQTIDKAERVVITSNGERHPVIKSVVKAKHKGRTLLVENFIDISALKKIEAIMQKNQTHLELMNEKLRVVGGLTRHDVQNKLSAINSYSYLLKKKNADRLDIVDDLSKIEQSVKESTRIFDFARVYEQLGVEDLIDVDVEKTVDEAVGMFSDLTFRVVNDCHGLTVRADSLLRQLVYNLIDNTRKYGEKTTTARIYYRKTVQGNLQLIYKDDGVGIPLENKKQLFKKVFSTGGSTGFGLFLSEKMMEVYGWTITEESEPGKGAKFVITIPSQLFAQKNG